MIELDSGDGEDLVGLPEDVIPVAVAQTAEAMMGNGAIVASFVLAAFRGSDGKVHVAKAAYSDTADGIKRLGKSLREIADEIDAGEYDTEVHAKGQNSPGGGSVES